MEAHWGDSIYKENIKEHRKEFLQKVSKHSPTYSDFLYEGPRVVMTVSCEDTDSIPKVSNAGKVFRNKPVPYQLMHNGVKIAEDCYVGSYMTDITFGLQGHNEPQEERVFYEVLKHIPPGATMIECGSYWAYYSLWFCKVIPSAKIYLIEPSQAHLEIGMKNFELNHMKGNFTLGVIGPNTDYPEVPRIYIDSFLEQNKIEHVDILHCDIQGYEAEMLMSAMKSINESKIDYFFISTHSSQLHQQIIDFLKAKNYLIIAEHSLRKSYSVDGLIAARRIEIKGPDQVTISQ